MQSRFTICAYDKTTCLPALYYLDAGSAELAIRQFYEHVTACGKEDVEIVTVAVFHGHLADCARVAFPHRFETPQTYDQRELP
jgi:hypothetical protein